jgi:hypothetical protein
MPHAPALPPDPEARRRRGVRRTALALGALALAVYALFMLAGSLGQ